MDVRYKIACSVSRPGCTATTYILRFLLFLWDGAGNKWMQDVFIYRNYRYDRSIDMDRYYRYGEFLEHASMYGVTK